MTIMEVNSLLTENNPKTVEEIKKLGIKLRSLGSGAYRYVYKVVGLPIVLKIPLDNPASRRHSEEEIKVIKKINRLKKYRKLRKYMPYIHFYNPTTRMIGMQYYDTTRNPYKNRMASILTDLIEEIWPGVDKSSADVHSANIAFDSDGQIKIIDLGYFNERGQGWDS